MKQIFFLVSFYFLFFNSFSQNHLGFHIFMPVSNTYRAFDSAYNFHGNTQLSLSAELFYERENKNKLHHIGISYQPYSFRYFNSDYFETITENYYTLNYTFFRKYKLGDIPFYSGSGAIISVLNEQKEYNDMHKIKETFKFGDVVKLSAFIEEKLPLINRTKKVKVTQSFNFRFGFDLLAKTRNDATFIPICFISCGYSMSLTKK